MSVLLRRVRRADAAAASVLQREYLLLKKVMTRRVNKLQIPLHQISCPHSTGLVFQGGYVVLILDLFTSGADFCTDSEIQSLTREDLHELFPGPEKLKLRRTIFGIIHKRVGSSCSTNMQNCTLTFISIICFSFDLLT